MKIFLYKIQFLCYNIIMPEFTDSLSKKVYENYIESVADQDTFTSLRVKDSRIPLDLIRKDAFLVCYNPKSERLAVISKSEYANRFHFSLHEIKIDNPPSGKVVPREEDYQFVYLNCNQVKNLLNVDDIILFNNTQGAHAYNEGSTIVSGELQAILNFERDNPTYQFRFYPKTGRMLLCIFGDKKAGVTTNVFKVYTREGYTLEKYDQLLREIGYNI